MTCPDHGLGRAEIGVPDHDQSGAGRAARHARCGRCPQPADRLGVGGGFRRFLQPDEPTLQGVADPTGGSCCRAQYADRLFVIFLSLPGQITLQEQDLELSFALSGADAVLAKIAVGQSLRWNLLL